MDIQNQPSFGMALYMPSKSKITKKLGSYAAEEAEKARGTLKQLAKEVDIYVKPKLDPAGNIRDNGFECMITDIGKNKFSRWLRRQGQNVTDGIDFRSHSKKPLSISLLETVQKMKQDFLKFSK